MKASSNPNPVPTSDPKRELFRHTLATLAYRAGKAVRNAPAGLAEFRTSEGARTPGQILAHVGDLFDWALSIARGKQAWRDSKPLPWEKEVERFFAALKAFDDYLASGEPLHAPEEKLFQGPVADALTHVGQIAILRRMAGAAVKAENYYQARLSRGAWAQSRPRPSGSSSSRGHRPAGQPRAAVPTPSCATFRIQ